MAGRDFQLVRYKTGKDNFEILTKPGNALKFKEGKLGFSNVLFADEIFTDQARGKRANEADLLKTFNTSNIEECAKVILEKGELQLTAGERKEKVDQKRAEMVNYIHKYYIDPRTKTPHPMLRIENAFEELHINVDPDLPAERQLQEKVLRRLPEVLPIKKSEIEGTLTIPNKFLGQAMGLIHKFATVSGDTYSSEGCTMNVAFVPGDYDTFFGELRDLTKGEYTFDVAGGAAASSDTEPEKKGKGRGRGGRGGGRGRGKKWEPIFLFVTKVFIANGVLLL